LSGEFEKKQLDTFNLKGRQDGIDNWLVGTNEFKDWLNGIGKLLWCRGSGMFLDRTHFLVLEAFMQMSLPIGI